MCRKHIPKEYLRREIIRFPASGIRFLSYRLFSLTPCKHPKSHWTRHFYTWRPQKLYRITSVFRISYSRIHLRLLCFSILKEFNSNLWEQCVRQYIFILLDPLLAFFAECV